MKPEWAVRIFSPSSGDTIDIFSSFKGANQRVYDTLVVFQGIYGNGDYLIWKIHKDLYGTNMAGASLEVKLFLESDKDKPFWTQKYEILDVMFKAEEEKYILYAITPSTAVLDTLLYEHGVNSVQYEKEQDPKKVLKDVLEKNNIFKVEFYSFDDENIDYKYKSLSIRREWTVRDFINYICDPNHYEWKVLKGVLFVGRELPSFIKWRSGRIKNAESEDVSESSFFKKYMGDTKPMKVFSQMNDKWRCIWARHSVGYSGGMSQGCFVRVNEGQTPKHIYISSLEGEIERHESQKITETKSFPSVSLGSILKDEGDEEIAQVSTEQKEDNLTTHNPYLQEFIQQKAFNIANPIRSYTYLDDEAGLLFPIIDVDGEHKPHSLLFHPFGRNESAILGGYVPRKDLTIPYRKTNKDFRLHLPHGFCLYVKEDGDMILQLENSPIDSIPDLVEDVNSMGMHMLTENENGDKEYLFQLDLSNVIEFKNSDEGYKLLVDGSIFLQGGNSILINTTGDGKNIEISSSLGKTLIQGGGNKLSHADHVHDYSHTHQVPIGPAIPGPPSTAVTQSTTDTQTHSADQGTTDTEAD